MPTVRFRDRDPAPWPNGLGTTTEIARAASAPGWRLSIATIDGPAWFSSLPGIERALLVLGPAALTLEIDDVAHELGRFDVVRFGGEQPVRALGVERPVRVLNLMTDRALGEPVLVATTGGELPTLDDLLAVVALDDGPAQAVGDTLVAPTAEELARPPLTGHLAAAGVTGSASRASRPPG